VATTDDERYRTLRRAARHWRWGREQGWGRLVEEDELDLVARVAAARRRARWRARRGLAPGAGTPVLVVGLQRSGTNLVLRVLGSSPAVEVHGENDRRVFRRFRVIDERLPPLVARSRHAAVVVKPLCDSHRTAELLAATGSPRALALWVHRDVDDRARSAVAKFGTHNRDVLVALAEGRSLRAWQAGGLGPDELETVRALDPHRLDPHSAAALFWYLRNSIPFGTSAVAPLVDRTDVRPLSYDALRADPVATGRALLTAVGAPPLHLDPRAVRRGAPGPRLDLDARVRRLCDDLGHRLDGWRHGRIG
jgi:hypothetical protein